MKIYLNITFFQSMGGKMKAGPMDELDLNYELDYLFVYREKIETTRYTFKSPEGVFDKSLTMEDGSRIYAGLGKADYTRKCATIDADELKPVFEDITEILKQRSKADKETFFNTIYTRPIPDRNVYIEAEFEKKPSDYENEIRSRFNEICDKIISEYDWISSMEIKYTVINKTKDMQDSENNHITEDSLLSHLAVKVISDRTSGFDSIGGTLGAEILDKLDTLAYSAVKKAKMKLDAKPLPSNLKKTRVLIGGKVTGVFIHEMFGHLAESDSILARAPLGKKYKKKIASIPITIKDIPWTTFGHGNLKYDDEMTEARDVYILKNGVVEEFMTNRKDNLRLKNEMGIDIGVTGNGRADDFSDNIMVRMRNTIMEQGTFTEAELLKKLGTGVYLVGSSGGYVYTQTGNFVVHSKEAYWVEDGEIKYPIKTSSISGNSMKTVEKIVAVGDESTVENFAGFCGKYWQWVPVSGIAPAVLVSEMDIHSTLPMDEVYKILEVPKEMPIKRILTDGEHVWSVW
jgi:TldD protein